MRTTVRIDDDLLRELKKRAKQEDASLTQQVNQAIRRGLEPDSAKKRVPRFKQKTYAMGTAKFNVDKALAFAAELEDEEIMRKLALGK